MTSLEIASRAMFAVAVESDAGALTLRYLKHEIAFDTEVKGPQDFASVADRAVVRRAISRRTH